MNTTIMERKEAVALAHRRDRLIIALAELADNDRNKLLAAGRRLNQRVGLIVERQRTDAMRRVRRRLASLEVARRYFLESQKGPPVLASPSDIDLDGGELPVGFDPCCLGLSGCAPQWMKECHAIAGEFDHEWSDIFVHHVMYMRNLHRGTWGDWHFETPVDLEEMTAQAAWLALETRPLFRDGHEPRPQSTLDRAMADVDPDVAAEHAEDPVAALSDIVCEFLDDDLDLPLTDDRCWDILLAALLLMHPSFDPERAGVMAMPPWEIGENGCWWRARSFPMFVWRGRSSNEELLCELASRAARLISPPAMEWFVSPLRGDDIKKLADELLVGSRHGEVVKSLTGQGGDDRLQSPQFWNRTQLCADAGGISDEKFRAIRSFTNLPALRPRQKDIEYSAAEVRLLIRAARENLKGKQDWDFVADRWQRMLDDAATPPRRVK